MSVIQAKTAVLVQAPSMVAGAISRARTGSSVLATNGLLGALDAVDLSKLVDAGRWQSFSESQAIACQGDRVESVCFITEGRAKAEMAAPVKAAYRAVVNLLGPGDDVGLLSLIDDALHPVTVTAMEDIRALAVPMATMRDYLGTHAGWYKALAEIAVSRLRTNGHWLQALI